MITVMIVQNESLIRQGLAVLLEGTEGFSCIGAYDDCRTFLEDLAAKKPDVVLLDLEASGTCGAEGIREALSIRGALTILALTVHDDEELVFEILAAGAQGYLTKPIAPAKLLEAIHDAYHGGSPMSSPIARKVVTFFRNGKLRAPTDAAAVPLTRREHDVLSSLSEGRSYKEIARTSRMSVNTVRYHIRNLYDKLEVHSQSEAVAKGLRQGLI